MDLDMNRPLAGAAPALERPAGQAFLFLLTSSRPDGNSELLARRAAASLPAGAKQTWLDLGRYPLNGFEDLRHFGDDPWRPTLQQDERTLLYQTLAATDLVIVAPLYWYSMPAPAKLYLDHWSTWLRIPHLDFKQEMGGAQALGCNSAKR